MREPQTPHFYDFGISGRVPEPQNQYYLSLETPGYLNEIKKEPWGIFQKILFWYIIFFGNSFLSIFEKTGAGNSAAPPNNI